MSSKIRKISVGKDFPNNVIHYMLGQSINIGDNQYIITEINRNISATNETGIIIYDIFVTDGSNISLWNTIEGMPVKVEYDLSFN